MKRPATLATVLLALVGLFSTRPAVTAAPAGADASSPSVQFNRDIRPILSDNCYACHGPDANQREADLRLDVEAAVLADRGGYQVVVPGDASESELYLRVSSEDDEYRMPPADSGKKLTAEQVELVRRWIEQGANWQKHWSFIRPERPPLPQVENRQWPRNPIDHFVLARLEREGLSPSPEAERATLIRRVTLDLTGLPPTPAEVDAFLADDAPDAYEKVVERLLQSPRFGERMAARWLDAARYADTSGYQNDGPRSMWRWRDWVIDALNDNMPFDQFTIEQIAGDMLPDASLDQKIASGFNRNHRGNSEGGVIPEEYQVEYVVDRVETTSTVWLGLTLGCARCHEHKYDPFTQREFYQLFAYFNNVPEHGRAIKEGNSPPMIKAPTEEQQRELAEFDRKIAAAEGHFESLEPQLAAAQTEWEQSPEAAQSVDWSVSGGLVARYALDGDLVDASGNACCGNFADGEATFASGRIGEAAQFDGRRFIDAGDVGKFGYFDKFSLGAWVRPHGDGGGTVLSRMTDAPRADGFYVRLEDGRVQVNLVKRWLDDAVRVETEAALEAGRWHHLMMTYDGSRLAAGITVYVDGRPEKLVVHLDGINQSFASSEPLRIGGGGGPDDRFHGAIDDVRVYGECLSAEEVAVVATADAIADIIATPAGSRTLEQGRKLRAYFLEKHAPAEIQEAHRRRLALREEKAKLIESVPTVMVMEEIEPPRETHVLIRGQYDKPGERVAPGVPASLPPLGEGAPNNRLGFARWLVDPSNPLTARVAVNRYWQMYFGTGIVKTVEDFGSQGEWPTHPQLLDWLATEFVESGWDVKALQKLIVTSATYRQSSKVTPELLKKDPDNRLLARGPRFRLPAQTIRDQALAISGLLVESVGGPSVRPYQPEGLWKEVSGAVYTPGEGEELYRRSLYTYWKRTVAPPTMMTFDASSRETCTVRQSRTNTPLQALTLLNEVSFVEASRRLAERMMTEGGSSPAERIVYAFRLATARRPSPAELQVLVDGFGRHRDQYASDPDAAKQLVSVGASTVDEQLDVVDLAAYTAVASVILNLDEVITRE